MRNFTVPALLAGFALASSAAAQSGPQIRLEHPWVRATAPGQREAAAYLTLLSRSGDTLLAAGSPDALTASLHEERKVGNIAEMRDLPQGIPLPPGQPVTLHPGGMHIMLSELRHPLVAGQAVTLELTFRKAGTRQITAPVLPIGTRPSMPDMGAMPGMPGMAR